MAGEIPGQDTPQNPHHHDFQPCLPRSVGFWNVPCLSDSMQAVQTQTALVGAPELSTSWRKADQKFSVNFPLRWHLIIPPPSAVSHVFALLYEHSWLPKIWKSVGCILLVQWLLKSVQKDGGEQDFTKSAVWAVFGSHSPSSTPWAFSPVHNIGESKPLMPKLRGCSCTGQWWI